MTPPSQQDPLADLARSTGAFYARFGVSPRLPDAVDHFMEEVREFAEAVGKGEDASHIAEEAADVMVTLLGTCSAAGLGLEHLVRGIYFVIAKNDAKTRDTHEVRDRKIRPRKAGG
jgi:NTP pyrophosphatase (non-canonical NTP hydrolase)